MFPVAEAVEKKFDLLIWGTIHPYKGVIDFLKFAKNKPEIRNIKIAISGICPDPTERKELNELLTNNITYINDFQDIEEIAKLANESRFVLFTYNSESILSSGSLMDSIRMGTSIIGPNKGAFKLKKSKPFTFSFTTKDSNTISNAHILLDDEKYIAPVELKNNSFSITFEKEGKHDVTIYLDGKAVAEYIITTK